MADPRPAEIVVVGAGPAGLAAATRASEAGNRVLVLDESPRVGGQIWRHRDPNELPALAREWIRRFEQSGATLMSGASVVDVRSDRSITVETEQRAFTVQAGALILCVGARERFLPFPGWTLPGVVGVGGGQALLKAGMGVRGRRVVVAGSGPLLLPVAALLAKKGAKLQLVAEQTPRSKLMGFAFGLWRSPSKLVDAARYRSAFVGTRFTNGEWVTSCDGDTTVREVTLSNGSRTRTFPCDLLCVGYNLVPAVELPRLAGCNLDQFGNVQVDEFQETSQKGIYCAGETTGLGGMDAALVEGEIAGYAAADLRDGAEKLFSQRAANRRFAESLREAFALRDELRKIARDDTLVCRCEDVTFGRLAACSSTREAKLYTRAGMGPCQGRVCGAALDHLFNWDADTVRTPALAARVGTLTTTE